MPRTIDIHDYTGALRHSALVTKDSRRIFKLMEEDSITLKFSYPSLIPFTIGDWCDVPGMGRFSVTQDSKPQRNASTGGFDYELKMEALYRKWRNKKMRHIPGSGASETSWSLTTSPRGHMEAVQHNVNALINERQREIGSSGFPNLWKYYGRGGDNGYWQIHVHDGHQAADVSISEIDDTDSLLEDAGAKTISYDSTSILDALTAIAEAYQCEWWIDEDTIHLGRCIRKGDYITFEEGDNCSSITTSKTGEDYVTRLLAFGSDRNISPRYRKQLLFQADEDTVDADNVIIRDSRRILNADWFIDNAEDCRNSEGNTIQLSDNNDLTPVNIIQSGNDTIDPYNDFSEQTINIGEVSSLREIQLGDALLYTNLEGINGGKWDVRLSEFHPALRFYTDLMIPMEELEAYPKFSSIRAQLVIEGFVNKNGSLVKEIDLEAEGTGIVQSHTVYQEISFEDFSFTLTGKLDKLNLILRLYATPSQPGSRLDGISLHFNGTHAPLMVNENPNKRLEGVIAEVIDEIGNVTGIFRNCIFNKHFADDISERSWIAFPSDANVSTGTLFRLPQLYRYKVKSSYFTPVYASYQGMENIAVNGIATRRLMLPSAPPDDNTRPGYSHNECSMGYVDYKPGLNLEEGVEDVKVFEDIYPRLECHVRDIEEVRRWETVDNDDNTKTREVFTAYRIRDDYFSPVALGGKGYKFDSKYIIEGQTLQIVFLDGYRYTLDDKDNGEIPAGKNVGDLRNPDSGQLNGQMFEVRHTLDDDGCSVWEVVRDSSTFIPNEIIHPQIDDTFAIIGYDIEAVDEFLVPEAEKELLDTAVRYLDKLNRDTAAYECTPMPDVIKDILGTISEDTAVLMPGTRINLIHPTIPTTVENGTRWGRKSRIIGYEVHVDIPYDKPRYTVGEKPNYSRFGELKDNVEAMQWSLNALKQQKRSSSPVSDGSASSGTGTSSNAPYIIGVTDITPPTDYNVFSSLRSRSEFPGRHREETIDKIWQFSDGITAGNYVQHNTGAAINADGTAEMTGLELRGGLKVNGSAEVGSSLTVGSSGFETGPLGFGARIWEENGALHLETDFLDVRRKFTAREIEIQEETHVGGMQISSPASMRINRVIPQYSGANLTGWKCTFRTKDSDGRQIYNQFAVNDMAMCRTFNLADTDGTTPANRYYWRAVTSTGYIEEGDDDYDVNEGREGFVVLTDRELYNGTGHSVVPGKDMACTDTPLPGDCIVTVGNTVDETRQNVIITASYGTGSPYIYQYTGIDRFQLTPEMLRVKISPNGNYFSGHVVMESGAVKTDSGNVTINEYVTDIVEGRLSSADLALYDLVLSNEMAAVACDKDGIPYGELPQTTVRVFKGGSIDGGWDILVECTGCTVQNIAGTVRLLTMTDATATINIIASKSGCPELEKTMTIIKVCDGEDGIPGSPGSAGMHAVTFEIEPDVSIVSTDLEGNPNPEVLACKVFCTLGGQLRQEIPTLGNGSFTTLLSGSDLLFSDGRMLVNGNPAEGVDVNLVLKYTYIYRRRMSGPHDEILWYDEEDSPRVYMGALTLPSGLKAIRFNLFNNDVLLDVQTVCVMTDATKMATEFTTRFEQTENAISLNASALSSQESRIANLEVTADGLTSTVESVSGGIGSILEGGCRNLLLSTNKGNEYWQFITDGNTSAVTLSGSTVLIAEMDTAVHPSCTFERFAYPVRPKVIEEGKTYTVSFFCDSTSVNPISAPLSFNAWICHEGDATPICQLTPMIMDVKNGNLRYSATFIASRAALETQPLYLYIGLTNACLHTWNTIRLWDLKLEKGTTASSWSPAPEDYAEEVGERVQRTVIEQTDSSITMLAENVGSSLSQIRQTAENISLNVDSLKGVLNIMDGTWDGQDWVVKDENDNFLQVDAGNGRFVTGIDARTHWQLISPGKTLVKNKVYTLSFYAYAKGGNADLLAQVCDADTGSVLTMMPSASIEEMAAIPRATYFEKGERFIYQFGTHSDSTTRFNLVFDMSANMDAEVVIHSIMVEEGNVAHEYTSKASGLLSTGIDISRGKIVVTADSTTFRDNNGSEVALFENGKIKADFIDVKNLEAGRVKVTRSDSSESIELGTDEVGTSLGVFRDGEKVTSVNGAYYPDGPESIFGDDTGNAVGSLTIEDGQQTLTAPGNENPASTVIDTQYSNYWNSSSRLPIVGFLTGSTIAINVFAKGFTISEVEPGVNGAEDFFYPPVNNYTSVSYASATVAIYLDVAGDIASQNPTEAEIMEAFEAINIKESIKLLTLSESRNVATDSNWHVDPSTQKRIYDDCPYSHSYPLDAIVKAVSANAKGYCRLRMVGTLQARHPGSYARVSWSPLQANVGVKTFMSTLFSNGVCWGSSSLNYASVWYNSAGKMCMEYCDQSLRMRINNGKIQTYTGYTGWMSLPIPLFRGLVSYNSGTDSYAWDSHSTTILPDNTRPVLTKASGYTDSVKFPWPSAWPINEYDVRIRVTAVGTRKATAYLSTENNVRYLKVRIEEPVIKTLMTSELGRTGTISAIVNHISHGSFFIEIDLIR